jgi:hypothetical protein
VKDVELMVVDARSGSIDVGLIDILWINPLYLESTTRPESG